ncbi:uncharacterized protein LOC134535407 [Bacillus rossius redtenbacheri]|uniref:uncharacterized protein LOC134535407 n=1 Tax=Bacillus rossius redtenbacheri TaxID=93214 RepID=UPI002FDE2F5B
MTSITAGHSGRRYALAREGVEGREGASRRGRCGVGAQARGATRAQSDGRTPEHSRGLRRADTQRLHEQPSQAVTGVPTLEMACNVLRLAITLLLLADVRRSFVDPAPLDGSSQGSAAGRAGGGALPSFDEVKQLEDLKNSFGKTFSVLKSHSSVYSEVNGQRSGHAETKEEVNRDGSLVARVDQKMELAQEPGATPSSKVRTEVDIPARGVHKTLVEDSSQGRRGADGSQVTENGERRSAPAADMPNMLEKYGAFSGVQYSPQDMAEYVFWTGDEKGVTLAIEEFLQEGLMSREEAVAFLQEIKVSLEYLQAHYAKQQLRQQQQQQQQQGKERVGAVQKALRPDKSVRAADSKPDSADSTDPATKKASDLPATAANRDAGGRGLSDEDYEELLERLRVADFLYTEYSLEEVIYQLAKVMFSQSLTRGSAEAQEALQKFTSFLEAEAEQGHISRSLEKKVLDVLIASLMDTLTERPQQSPGSHLLHQLLLLSPGAASGEAAPAGSDIARLGDKSHQSTLAKGRGPADHDQSPAKAT